MLNSLKSNFLKTLIFMTFIFSNDSFAQSGFTYGGKLLTDSGEPLSGTVSFDLEFYSGESCTNCLLFSKKHSGMEIKNGLFNLFIELNISEIQKVQNNPQLYIQIRTLSSQGTKVYPRQKFGAVPFALSVPVDGKTIVFENGKLKAVGTLSTGTADKTTSVGVVGPEGPQGPPGPQGLTGATGAKGPRGLGLGACRRVTAIGPAPNYASNASCGADERMVSGGGQCGFAGSGFGVNTDRCAMHLNGATAVNTWSVDCYQMDMRGECISKSFAICCKIQ